MNDSLLYHFNILKVGDTTIVSNTVADSNAIIQPLPINFFHATNVQINPVLNSDNSYILIITCVLLVLLGIISTIRYFLPDRLSMIFSLKTEKQLQRTENSNAKVPGTLITGFFWINFLISTGIFIFILFQRLFENQIIGLSDFEVMSYIFFALIGFFAYRFVVIFGAATIFQTHNMMKQQILISRNILFITGVFLVPVILLILYVASSLFIYVALVVIAFMQAYRMWIIVIIGKSSAIFSGLHIILYLCALEIVPVLVLIRLIGNGSGL